MTEIEKFVVAQKEGEGRFTIQFNPAIAGFIKALAEEHGMSEIEIVEKLNADILGLAFREESEGKQIRVADPHDGTEKVVKLLNNKNST